MAEAAGRASASGAGRKRLRIARIALAAECAVALAAAAAQGPGLWASRWVQDDAYVSFRYARNLVEGHGLVYNVGARVEGYTNFLWTMLSAVPLAWGVEDPLPFMHGVSAALWIISYLVLLVLGVRLWAEGIWGAPLAVIPLATHWSFNMWFFSGMETPLVCLLTILAVYFFSLDPDEHPHALFWASLSGVALAMTRPDGLVTLAALAVAGAVLYGRRILRGGHWRTYVLLPVLPVAMIFLPYQAWRIAYYGSFFPNTYYTKVAYLPFYTRGWDYLTRYLATYRLVPYLPLVAGGAVVVRGGVAVRFFWSSLLVAVFVSLYVVRLGGDFMEWRFLTPITGVVYPAIVVGAALLAQEVARLASRWMLSGARAPGFLPLANGGQGGLFPRLAGLVAGVAAVLCLTLTTQGANPNDLRNLTGGQETIGLLRRYGDPGRFDWRSVGKLFDQVVPKDARIATTSAGMIPFFCNRPCLDLHGLTDPEIARGPVDPNNRGRMGHEHWLDDYTQIRARGVGIVLNWADPSPYPRALLTPPKPEWELISARLPRGDYVDFTILKPLLVDREALRRDERLVFFGALPIADKNQFYSVRSLFACVVAVDALDWETEASETAHHFQELHPSNPAHYHSYHTKLLRYAAPLEDVALEDNGRRIYGGALWQIDHVSPFRDLVMVARFDRVGEAVYDIEVNGRLVPQQLVATGGEERWDEAWVEIPARLLVSGKNEFHLQRTTQTDGDAEWYYMWFLQAPADEVCAAAG